jgi:hypothetical protein
MNLPYLLPRAIRHFLPERITRFLLLRSVIIKPGLETAAPTTAVGRYGEILKARGVSLRGRRVLVFGYGGRFDVGIGFLELGATQVVLSDKYAPPQQDHNRALAEEHGQYFLWKGDLPRPDPACITLVDGDIRDAMRARALAACEIVVSNSVYEHLEDVDGITRVLARLTDADGLHIHFVDLRDHFFRYPFEMLHYSENAWRRWLNPTSNHNRFRLWDYRRVFEGAFRQVEIEVLQRDDAAYDRARNRIRPEFISGNRQEDAATLIRIVAGQPRR